MDSEKMLTIFLSAAVATLVNYLVNRYNNSRINKKIIRNIDQELREIQSYMNAQLTLYEGELVSLRKYEWSNVVPRIVENTVYQGYFKDVALDIPPSRRTAYQLINHDLSMINASILRWHNIITDKQKSAEVCDEDFSYLVDIIETIYKNSSITSWHIDRLLSQKNYDIKDMRNEERSDYQRQITRIRDKISSLK
ncbi:hypothetical protein P3381_20315 [Vibrio parahaemolyticus]|nr:hypothetical protein [Vibrio parahaemolyticus]MDF4371692.1 hypothetical protein [Vibrio parahaemolyticus]